MLVVGIDLAAEPGATALARIEWSARVARVLDVAVNISDDEIVEAVGKAAKAGIDCPLGWPAAFVDFVATHHTGHVTPRGEVAGRDWRRRLAYRRTDEVVAGTFRRWPLSVSADRIGYTAMRAAGLLARLHALGQPVDRSGAGVAVEVYPAASLHKWGLPDRGYKGKDNLRQLSTLVDRLQVAAPWLELGPHESLCRTSDHALDAVVAAITAAAAALGHTAPPGPDMIEAARTEGWIALPTVQLADLQPQ